MASSQARFSGLVQASQGVGAERGRKGKVRRIASYLRSLSPSEAAIAATYLAGEIPQGRIGIGPSLHDRSLTKAQMRREFARARPAPGLPEGR